MAVSKAPSEDSTVVSPFEPRPVTLKDGRTVTLRSATQDDAERVLAYFGAFLQEAGNYILGAPDDPLPTVEAERQWLERFDPVLGTLLVVAEFEQQIVGGIETRVQNRRRLAHVANIGMASRQAFWNSGIGTAMMAAMIDWCRSHPSIFKLELEVFADNPRAIALYRNCGFIEEGRRGRHIQREPGQFIDELVMGLWL